MKSNNQNQWEKISPMLYQHENVQIASISTYMRQNTKIFKNTYMWEKTVFWDKVSLSCGFWTSGILLCTSENICILLWKTGVDPFFRDSVNFIHGLIETIRDSCTTLQNCFWWITLGILVLPYIEGHYRKELYRLAIITGKEKKIVIPKGWWKRAWEGTAE